MLAGRPYRRNLVKNGKVWIKKWGNMKWQWIQQFMNDMKEWKSIGQRTWTIVASLHHRWATRHHMIPLRFYGHGQCSGLNWQNCNVWTTVSLMPGTISYFDWLFSCWLRPPMLMCNMGLKIINITSWQSHHPPCLWCKQPSILIKCRRGRTGNRDFMLS